MQTNTTNNTNKIVIQDKYEIQTNRKTCKNTKHNNIKL